MTTARPRAEVAIYTSLASPIHEQLNGETASIGRASDCTIPIKARYLSRKHAEIIPLDGGWALRGCGSANGAYLNGVRAQAGHPLRSGQRPRLGDTGLLFARAAHKT